MESAILKMASEELQEQFDARRYRFTLKPRWMPASLRESAARIREVQLEGKIARYTNFKVWYEERGQQRSTQVQLSVEAEMKAPVTVRRMKSGTRIEKDDLHSRWVTIRLGRSDLVESTEALIGKRLQRTLLSGQPFRKNDISRQYLVEAGDQVRVIINRQGIRVEVTGVAREGGAKGDRIRIYSNQTKRKYVGEVVRPGITLWKNTL